jgi:hypothetical protein
MRYLLLLLLLLPRLALAAPTLDAQNNFEDFSGGGTVFTLSGSITIGSLCTTDLIIVVSVVTHSNIDVSDMTIGGSAATFIDGHATVARRISMWYRVGVSPGANTISMNFSGGANTVRASARSFCGVNQTTPIGTPAKVESTGTSASVNVSSATGELVIDAIVARNPGTLTLTVGGGGQVEDLNISVDPYQAESHKAGAGTVTMSWALSESQDWHQIGVSLKPAAAPAGGTRRRVVVVQ